MTRKFSPGFSYHAGGLEVRCCRGGKGPEDVVFEVRTPGGEWARVGMPALYLLFEGLCENEDIRYPPPAQGGEYLVQALRYARTNGWEMATHRLNRERIRAHARQRGTIPPVEPPDAWAQAQ